jgi:hypothetical protein
MVNAAPFSFGFYFEWVLEITSVLSVIDLPGQPKRGCLRDPVWIKIVEKM